MAQTKIQRLERRVAELTVELGNALAEMQRGASDIKVTRERMAELVTERNDARERADQADKAREMWCDKYHEQLARAGRAEGYAEALLAQAHPPMPVPPWRQPEFDQYGNRVFR
jgi:chromosome segregation ATPase